jgi:hypothetical protein
MRPSRWSSVIAWWGSACVVGLTLAGCSGLPPLALRPQPIPYADTLPIHEPANLEPNEIMPLLREATVGELGQPFDPDDWGKKNEALNLTHFDDVVNSAWFEHRIMRRELTAEEVGLGPTADGGRPEPPYVVTELKGAGISPGWWVRDAKGDVYLFKFDPPENLYLASAANTVSNRLFWAAGYHVPEDYIVVFDTASLVFQPKGEGPTREEIREILARTSPLPDSRYRAIASRLLPGKPKGPFRFRGVRKDDPNDHYLHQNRRELRGLYVMAAWTNHVDIRFANTLDVFIDPPGFLRHYLQDFGATLGSGTIRPHDPREGTEYNFDVWAFFARLFTFGFYTAGWEGVEYEIIDPSIGWLPVEMYHPGRWKPNWPNAAFRSVTAGDGYWGAKLVAALDEEMIRAAVGAGELPSRRPADTLTAILIARRDKTVRYWFDRVSPVENVSVECADASGDGFVLTFEDLGIGSGVRAAAGTQYAWELEDSRRGRHWRGDATATIRERQAIHVAPPGTADSCLSLDAPPNRSAGGAPLGGSAGGAAGEGEAGEGADVTAERLAVLRLRAGRFPPQTSEPRRATIYLLWTGEEGGYTVVGLEH